MELIQLANHQALITEISDEILDLANILEIPFEVERVDDHIYMVDKTGDPSLGSFIIRRDSDELVTSETFSEILLDIKSGMTVLEAYNKHGYTFGY